MSSSAVVRRPMSVRDGLRPSGVNTDPLARHTLQDPLLRGPTRVTQQAPLQRFTDDGTMEKQTGSKIHGGVNAGRDIDDNDIQKVSLSRHHLINKDRLMRFYNELVSHGHQGALDGHVTTILGQLGTLKDDDAKTDAANAWNKAKGGKAPQDHWSKLSQDATSLTNKINTLNQRPDSKNRNKALSKLSNDLSGVNIKIDNKKSDELPKWSRFQDIFQWFPGNLVEGPASDLRSDDPGSNFDVPANRTIGAPVAFPTAYNDIGTYLTTPTMPNATTACNSLSAISTTYTTVHAYDYTKWQATVGQPGKYNAI